MGPHPELLELDATDLVAGMERGELTAESLTRRYLERIEVIDRAGPALHAVIEVNPDALEIARSLDRERGAGAVRGPLHGVPVLVKDNIDTGDLLQTTAGSLALLGSPAPRDADLVARLRAAGAVLLGKTNLSEWANFRSTRSASGWSGRGRQTLNPHVLDRSPAGSSSGSAVAVAAGLCAVAVGTETNGSIISPSSLCGVVGMKPTVGVVSQDGIIPISRSQDSAGPHARSVRDAALLLEVLSTDGARYSEAAHEGLDGLRLGVLGKPFTGYSEHSDRVFGGALEVLRAGGAELVEVEMTTMEELRASAHTLTILLHEFKDGLNRYLAGRTGVPVRTLADVIRFNEDHAGVEMPYFRQELLERAEATAGLDAAAYVEAREKVRELAGARGVDALIDENRLDALVCPSGMPAWTVDRISGDRVLGGASTPSAVLGYPIVTVPAGLAFGALPVGIAFFGRAGTDALLLRAAAGFEARATPRRAPRFLPTLDLP